MSWPAKAHAATLTLQDAEAILEGVTAVPLHDRPRVLLAMLARAVEDKPHDFTLPCCVRIDPMWGQCGGCGRQLDGAQAAVFSGDPHGRVGVCMGCMRRTGASLQSA